MVVPEHNDARVPADVRAEEAAAATAEGDDLDAKTKDELLEEAEARGVGR